MNVTATLLWLASVLRMFDPVVSNLHFPECHRRCFSTNAGIVTMRKQEITSTFVVLQVVFVFIGKKKEMKITPHPIPRCHLAPNSFLASVSYSRM